MSDTTWDSHHRSVARLQTFLAGEAAAMAIYHRLADRFPEEPHIHQCLHAHQLRHRAIERLLHNQGGTADSGMAAHPFTLCDDVAIDGGVDAVLACLAECEAAFAEDYRTFLPELDTEARELIRCDLLIAQRQTVHGLTTRLRHSLR